MPNHWQRWNFASVDPLPLAVTALDKASCTSSANSVTGWFCVGTIGPVSGVACFAAVEEDPEDLVGFLEWDGSLALSVGSLEMKSLKGQYGFLAEERGGYVDLEGTDVKTGKRHSWRLYCVIAADTDAFSDWTHPSQGFATFLMGTHPRLGACSPVARLEESILRHVHSFVKLSPIWADLEAKVEQAELHLCGDAVEPEFSPAELVRQYCAFLALKVEQKDWPSEKLSPPMIEYEGVRLVDEVWHLHIAMDCYEEDSMLLTGGHIIEHQPILGDDARERYAYTYDLHLQRCEEAGEEVDERCWPRPASEERYDDYGFDYGIGWGGCC